MVNRPLAILVHYRMYGFKRTCDVFGCKESYVRGLLTEPALCEEAESVIKERALTVEDEADLATRGFISLASRLFDEANLQDPDIVNAVAKVASTLDGIVVNRKLGKMFR